MRQETFFIGSMTCINCQYLIQETLVELSGVDSAKVDYLSGKAEVSFDETKIELSQIYTQIQDLGYSIIKKKSKSKSFFQFLGILLIIFLLSFVFKLFSTSQLATSFPIAQTGMSYGMVFIIGLLTSLHCIAMCGGINLSQTINVQMTQTLYSKLVPSFFYNTGRVISYTLIGALIGSLGSVLTVTDSFKNYILLFAGFFMLIMGINMLGMFPIFRYLTLRLPKQIANHKSQIANGELQVTSPPLPPPLRKLHGGGISSPKKSRSPFIVGILNGFMPCGPLQAMQLYALSTGSAIMGAISMLLFCLGTVPLMFILGAMGSILSSVKGKSYSKKIMNAGAILVAAMGVVMILNGFSFSGFHKKDGASSFNPVIVDGYQIVETTLYHNRYPNITVVKDVPVRWLYYAPEGSINGCNYRFSIREFDINHTFIEGVNIIKFLPTNTGRFTMSCWMSMIHGSINVIELGADPFQSDLHPQPAGVRIFLDQVGVAVVTTLASPEASSDTTESRTEFSTTESRTEFSTTVRGQNIQEVNINLNDDGFEPSIVVVLRNIPLRLILNIESFDPGNFRFIVPAFKTIFETSMGENIIELLPEKDFDFSTGDHIFYGYIKVVDDLEDIDIESIKDDVFEHETMIYPEEEFGVIN